MRGLRYVPACMAVLAFAAAGCSRGNVPDSKGQITMKGTVHEVTQTDGTQCWQFQSAKGKNYELQPAQVPHEILVDGQQVTIVVKTRTGGSFCKVGTIVNVVVATPQSGA